MLASVKSFFGSQGVAAQHVMGKSGDKRRMGQYRMLNDKKIRDGMVKKASELYRYPVSQIELRLYVGRFAGRTVGEHRRKIEDWARRQQVGAG